MDELQRLRAQVQSMATIIGFKEAELLESRGELSRIRNNCALLIPLIKDEPEAKTESDAILVAIAVIQRLKAPVTPDKVA